MENKWTAIRRLEESIHDAKTLIEMLEKMPDGLVAERITGSPGGFPAVHITVLDYDGFKQARRALRGCVKAYQTFEMEREGRNVHTYRWVVSGDVLNVFISVDPPPDGGHCRRVITGEVKVPTYKVVCEEE